LAHFSRRNHFLGDFKIGHEDGPSRPNSVPKKGPLYAENGTNRRDGAESPEILWSVEVLSVEFLTCLVQVDVLVAKGRALNRRLQR
jgi:hypothetical protein